MNSIASQLGDPAPRPHLPTLAGLRMAGALTVFLHHAMTTFGTVEREFKTGAAAAISMFIVLSGFVLTWNHGPHFSATGDRAFWLGRIARLWPVHLFCLAVALFVRYRDDGGDWTIWPKLLLNVGLLHCWVPVREWLEGFNGVAWFVATAMGLYLLFPWLLRLANRHPVLWYCGVLLFHLAILAVANFLLVSRPESAQTVELLIQANPLFRLFEFATGIAIGVFCLRGFRLRPGPRAAFWHTGLEIAALLLLMVSLPWGRWGSRLVAGAEQVGWPAAGVWLTGGGSTLLAVASLILVLASSRGLLFRIGSLPGVQYCGQISFAFFMIHLPVIEVVNRCCGPETSRALMASCSLLISVGLAALVHWLVELPGRDAVMEFARQRWALQPVSPSARLLGSRNLRPAMLAVTGLLAGAAMLWVDVSGALTAPVVPARGWDPDLPQEGIVFVGEATLRRVWSADRDGELELSLIWEEIPGGSRSRFVHVIDANETVLFQVPLRTNPFQSGRFVVDRFQIPVDDLKDAAWIGVGFWNKDSGTVRVRNGPRSMNYARLHIYNVSRKAVTVLHDSGLAPVRAIPVASETEKKPNPKAETDR